MHRKRITPSFLADFNHLKIKKALLLRKQGHKLIARSHFSKDIHFKLRHESFHQEQKPVKQFFCVYDSVYNSFYICISVFYNIIIV